MAWHLGKWDLPNTARFVPEGTAGDVAQAVPDLLGRLGGVRDGHRSGAVRPVHYARIVKGTNPGRVESVLGSPDLSETETIYVERINGTLRQWCRRFTRKTPPVGVPLRGMIACAWRN